MTEELVSDLEELEEPAGGDDMGDELGDGAKSSPYIEQDNLKN